MSQDEPQVTPIVADEAVREALWDYIDREGTPGLTGYARSFGLLPPDEQPGWEVGMFAGPDDPDLDLVWLLQQDNPNRVG